MKKLLLLIILISTALFATSQGIVQQVYGSAGSYYSNGTYSLSSTIGETITATFNSTNNFLTQGFQQPNYLATLVEDFDKNADIKVYPNPADYYINIDMGSTNLNDYMFELFDVTGKLLITGKISEKITKLDLGSFATDVYFIRLSSDNKLIKSFKVQKIN